MAHPILTARIALLPLLTRETLSGVRFRRITARSCAAGMLVAFAGGGHIVVGRTSPLFGLAPAGLEALTHALPGLLTDAIAALGADAIVSPTGSFSPRVSEYVVKHTPGLTGARGEVGLADAMTRWLEATRYDYAVTISLQIDWMKTMLDDIQALIELQINGVTGVQLGDQVQIDLDGDGKDEVYILGDDGTIYDQQFNVVGRMENKPEGCFSWVWGIMFGKEGPLRVPSFVVAHYLDQHLPRLRELATEVAVGRRTPAALADEARALVDLAAMQAAYKAVVPRVGLDGASAVRAVRVTAARFAR